MSEERRRKVGVVNQAFVSDGSRTGDVRSNDMELDVMPNGKQMEDVNLKRQLGLFGSVNFIVGSMIGAGIFITPSSVASMAKSPGLSLLVWVLGGLLSFLGSLVYMELGTVVPLCGSDYSYIMEAYGDLPAFLTSWVTTFFTGPAAMAFYALNFSQYVVRSFMVSSEDAAVAIKLLAAATLGIIAYVNSVNVKLAIRVQVIFTFAKMIGIMVLIASGVYYMLTGHTQYLSQGFTNSSESPGDIASAFYGALLSYGGWQCLTCVTEEVKNPHRTLPLAMLISIAIVTTCYVMVNVAYFTGLSPEEMAASPTVAIDFAGKVLGPAAVAFPIAIAISIFGAANGDQFTAGRVCYAASRNGHVMRLISYLHVTRFSPSPAIIMRTLIALPMVAYAGITEIIGFMVFIQQFISAATTLSVFFLRRKKKDAPRPFRVPSVVPIFLVIINCYFIVAPFVTNPRLEYILGLVCLGLGLIVYYALIRNRRKLPGMDKFTVMCQLLLHVVPPEEVKP